MKRILAVAIFLVFAFQASAQAQDTVNGWSYYRTVGSPATTSSQILSDSAKEGTKCQSFTVTLPPNTFVEWRKPLDRIHATPFALQFWYKLRNLNAAGNAVIRFQFFFQKGDSLRAIQVFQASLPTVGTWFQTYASIDTLSKLSSFDAIILRLYFSPANNGIADVVFDNLRAVYFHGGITDSIVTLDRFGDDAFKPTFSASRTSSNFGNVPVNGSRIDSFYVRNQGNAVLNVASVVSTNAVFAVNAAGSSVAVGDSMKVMVTFGPTSIGTRNGFVIFYHDAISSPDTIRVSGTGMQAIYLANKKEINFDSIHGNAIKIDSFVVTNNGNVNLVVKAKSSSLFFSVVPDSASVGISASVIFRVTFRPDTTIGRKNGWLLLSHNGPTSPDSIHVFGDVITGVRDDKSGLPTRFSVSQNYPNPFNPSTVINFSIPHTSAVSLRIYNNLGQEVAMLIEETMTAGEHSIRFEARNLPSGVYFYRLVAGEFSKTGRMTLLK
jgi:hypothetical protein